MLQQPMSVLVICTRRIGDVLLTTPLIRSIKHAWPCARVDALIFKGTQGILQNNPDIGQILTVPARPSFCEHLRVARQLYRRYDLAISTLTGDRPTLYVWLAGRYRIGFTDPARPSRLKQHMLHESIPFDDLHTHTVRMNLLLAETLDIAPIAEVVIRPKAEVNQLMPAHWDIGKEPYVVLHPFPKFPYKQWHEDGWVAVARWLTDHGMRSVLTGSPADDEQAYIANLARQMPPHTVNLAGKISLSDAASVIKGAAAYVGPDTATTHLSAALGIPTVALFGPTNPAKWGPWPKGWPAHLNPYTMHGVQQRGNVTLLQGSGDCVPCLKEGCHGHTHSTSDCLTRMTSQQVISALESQLRSPAPSQLSRERSIQAEAHPRTMQLIS